MFYDDVVACYEADKRMPSHFCLV